VGEATRVTWSTILNVSSRIMHSGQIIRRVLYRRIMRHRTSIMAPRIASKQRPYTLNSFNRRTRMWRWACSLFCSRQWFSKLHQQAICDLSAQFKITPGRSMELYRLSMKRVRMGGVELHRRLILCRASRITMRNRLRLRWVLIWWFGKYRMLGRAWVKLMAISKYSHLSSRTLI